MIIIGEKQVDDSAGYRKLRPLIIIVGLLSCGVNTAITIFLPHKPGRVWIAWLSVVTTWLFWIWWTWLFWKKGEAKQWNVKPTIDA